MSAVTIVSEFRAGLTARLTINGAARRGKMESPSWKLTEGSILPRFSFSREVSTCRESLKIEHLVPVRQPLGVDLALRRLAQNDDRTLSNFLRRRLNEMAAGSTSGRSQPVTINASQGTQIPVARTDFASALRSAICPTGCASMNSRSRSAFPRGASTR